MKRPAILGLSYCLVSTEQSSGSANDPLVPSAVLFFAPSEKHLTITSSIYCKVVATCMRMGLYCVFISFYKETLCYLNKHHTLSVFIPTSVLFFSTEVTIGENRRTIISKLMSIKISIFKNILFLLNLKLYIYKTLFLVRLGYYYLPLSIVQVS